MKGTLSKQQILELKADHRVERDKRYADRIKAILMLNEGFSVSQIAHCLLIDEKSVTNYRKRYFEGGLEALCNDEYYGSSGLLGAEELLKLKCELCEKIYPTTSAVREYVEKELNVSYSISGITKLLERLGFSYKKPQPVPGKADATLQQEFLTRLSKLKAHKSKENPILYLDSTHPQHNSHPDYGWLPKGENVELKTNTGRQRVTLNGALDSETHQILVQEDKNLNAENTIKFFKKIESAYPESEQIHLILDNAGYYKGRKIREYLQSSKIKLLYLPPYAPNLNLIERVWKFFKKKVLANRYYHSFLEFRLACLAFFKKQSWRAFQNELDSLLVDRFQIIGA